MVVIVNNDTQQLLKKGRIILPENDRIEVVENPRVVDEVVLSSDVDESVQQTLATIRSQHPAAHLLFANGGDRRDPSEISESTICADLDIEIVFGIGGTAKADASSRIIAALDL